MSYLGLLKSAIYVRAAPAKRWNMPAEVDKIADAIVERATEHKVMSINGGWFWDYCPIRNPEIQSVAPPTAGG